MGYFTTMDITSSNGLVTSPNLIYVEKVHLHGRINSHSKLGIHKKKVFNFFKSLSLIKNKHCVSEVGFFSSVSLGGLKESAASTCAYPPRYPPRQAAI